ncbi:MAG: hypothetical protein HQ558_03335 [Candidatus Omnitrophica bacterium]|nr:hypothetical protein [Candidatus Omnitrophota bacterium]
MKRRIMLIAVLVVFTVGILAPYGFCDIPKTLNFQGRLTDQDGNPLNGNHPVTFSIYDASTGGNKLWTETQTVNVSDGIYNCRLGSSTPLNIAFDNPYYLEVTISGQTLTPRQPISASPYALNAERFAGLLPDEFLRPNESGNVGIGIAAPTSKLDVDGKVRGKAVYSHDRSSGTKSTTSRSSVWVSGLATTINVQKNDIIVVMLGANLRNSGTGTTYIQARQRSGVGATSIIAPNWVVVTGRRWAGGSSIGIYRAKADGAITFQAIYHASSGTGYNVYSNIIAYVIGKQ